MTSAAWNFGAENRTARSHVVRGTRSFVLAFFFCWLLFGRAARAHDLEVDTLAIQLHSASTDLSGQFFLDPDLTRPGDAAESPEQERARVIAFIEKHVTLTADATALALSFEIRELYEKGGAVPGDSVVFDAKLPQGASVLSVSIRKPLEKLATTVTWDTTPDPTILVVGQRKMPVADLSRHSTSREKEDVPSAPSPPVTAQIGEYVWIGFVHIVPLGWDHILFVLALTIGTLATRHASSRPSRPYRTLFLELTAFTLAHTLTLALGALRIVQIPGSVVEPVIALSIAAMGVEHLFLTHRPSARFGLVAFFGLVHGLGFAGALHELGLSGSRFVLFLASFNVGVELGQAVIVVSAALLLSLASRRSASYERMVTAVSIAISVVGLSVGIWRILDAQTESATNAPSEQSSTLRAASTDR